MILKFDFETNIDEAVIFDGHNLETHFRKHVLQPNEKVEPIKVNRKVNPMIDRNGDISCVFNRNVTRNVYRALAERLALETAERFSSIPEMEPEKVYILPNPNGQKGNNVSLAKIAYHPNRQIKYSANECEGGKELILDGYYEFVVYFIRKEQLRRGIEMWNADVNADVQHSIDKNIITYYIMSTDDSHLGSIELSSLNLNRDIIPLFELPRVSEADLFNKYRDDHTPRRKRNEELRNQIKEALKNKRK